MCTVSWWHGEAGAFSVFFNRDELRTRTSSEPVEERSTAAGMRFLAPRDPAAGGTWLMANSSGVVVGVLNHYVAAAEAGRPAVRSRGDLPLACANCVDLAGVRAATAQLAPADFAPFFLLAWDGRAMAGWIWDGSNFDLVPAWVRPVTTSSYRTDEICRWRRERFARIVPSGARDELMAFHDDAAHADSAFNVRMRRPDARTESVCRVDVTEKEVAFCHRREDPDALAASDETVAAIARA